MIHVHVATALSLAKRGFILTFFLFLHVDKNRTEYSLLANYYKYRRCISTATPRIAPRRLDK